MVVFTWCCATAVACRHPVVFAWSFGHLLILGSRVRVPPLSLLIFPQWHDAPPSCFPQHLLDQFGTKSTSRVSDSAVVVRGGIPTAARPETCCRRTLHDKGLSCYFGPQCRAVVLNCSRQELKTITTIVQHQACSLRPSPIAARLFRKIHHTPLHPCAFA